MGNKARFFSRMSGALLMIGGAIGVSALSTTALPACSSDTGTVERPCPPGQVCSVNLTLIHTADIHSRLFPYDQVITQVDATLGLGSLNAVSNIGGVARMAYVINSERAPDASSTSIRATASRARRSSTSSPASPRSAR
jgi:2',3'-cyclic-nucleotide 2'-phosphodiesterase (5'-nucleotidase family)